MSAYSKEPSHRDPSTDSLAGPLREEIRPIAPSEAGIAATPSPAPSRRRQLPSWAAGGAPPLLVEMAQVANYCQGLELSVREEQSRADAAAAQVDGERAKYQQALLSAKLEIRRLSTELKKAALELRALQERSAQSAGKFEEARRRDEASRRAVEGLRAELADVRARTGAERDALENRLKSSDQDFKQALTRFSNRESQLQEQVRDLEARLKEQNSVADLARLELAAAQGRLQSSSEQHRRTTRVLEELETKYREVHGRCVAAERSLAEGKSKYRELVDRWNGAKQRHAALERELTALREANLSLTQNAAKQSQPPPAPSHILAGENTVLRQSNTELRKENENISTQLANARKALPLTDLLQLKEKELERLAQELARTPEGDPRRGAIASRREAVTLQRDQLSVMLKRFAGPG